MTSQNIQMYTNLRVFLMTCCCCFLYPILNSQLIFSEKPLKQGKMTKAVMMNVIKLKQDREINADSSSSSEEEAEAEYVACEI